MTATLPSAPSRPPRVDAPQDLDALIEEARWRARRRRQRRGALALVIALASAAVFLSLHEAGSDSTSLQPNSEPPAVAAVHVREGAGRELTIMDLPTNSRQEGPAGWFGLSAIGERGRLLPLVRCPDAADWCGEVESVAWSPDGQRLALSVTSFGSANPYNGLHVIDVVSGADRLVRAGGAEAEYDWFDLAWSPDSRQLAYVTRGRIYLMNADGSARRLLQTGPRGRDASPTWSPDGRFIAFANKPDRSSAWAVRAVDVHGRHGRLLVEDGWGPAWSPRGTIAYRRGCGIRLLGTQPRGDVTPEPLRGCLPGGPFIPARARLGPPAWSPDGTKIAFSAFPHGTYVINADGTALTLVARRTMGVYVGQQPRPAWRSAR
jgi:WD40-like Beta Propeller Repeat